MVSNCVKLALFHIFFAVNIHNSLQCPKINPEIVKAEYKSGEIVDQSALPITIDKIKKKMQDVGVFDFEHTKLNEMEKKELAKLFDAVEIMVASRNRQPASAQHNQMFSALRIVERAVKKQMKEGQISESLAAKFKWEKLGVRQRRHNTETTYYYNAKTNMRVFNTDAQDLSSE